MKRLLLESNKMGFLTFSTNLLLCLLLFSSCSNDLNEIERITAIRKKEAIEVSYNIELFYSTFGQVKARLQAPLMENYGGEKPYLEMKKGMNLTFYDENRNVKSNLTSKYAISKDDDNIFEARNDVELINSKGEKLNSEHLVWDSNIQKIHSDKFVKITTKNEVIMGEGFESNQEFTRYRMKKITATFNLLNNE